MCGSKLQLKKEVHEPAGRFGKAYVFLVARNKYNCLENCVGWTFVFSFLPWIWHPSNISFFFLESFFLAFFSLFFGENLPRKFPRNSREIGRFLREFVSKNPAKFDFFSRELSEALYLRNRNLFIFEFYIYSAFYRQMSSIGHIFTEIRIFEFSVLGLFTTQLIHGGL